MSTTQRIGFAALAAVVAAVAIVLLRPDESSERADDPGERAGQTTTDARAGGGRGSGGGPAAEPEPEPEPAPPVQRIALQGGQAEGGVENVTVTSGEPVTLLVTSDTADEIHLHGYDLTQDVAPGAPARFRFDATIEGSFEIESHTAQDAGLDPRIANLVVEPS